ncbi:MAG: hypothetical protein AB7F85_16390, partial [Hyphomonadaceae bacterium]
SASRRIATICSSVNLDLRMALPPTHGGSLSTNPWPEITRAGHYFLCVAAVPEPSPEKSIDMEVFYWKTRRLYYGLFSLLLLIFMGGSWVLLRTSAPELALQQCLSNLPFLLLCLLALLVPARWAQWTAGIAILLLTIGWSILFTSTIR